jgi:hypothetical protein
VTAGATTNNTSTISATPANGFTGNVAVSCAVTTTPANANKPITCSLSSSTLTISGTAAATATLTIASTATTTTHAMLQHFGREVGGTALAFAALCFVPFRRRRLGRMMLMLVTVGCFTAMIGCGGSGTASTGGGGTTTTVPGTTTGGYAVTVTAISGSITQTNVVNVTVN